MIRFSNFCGDRSDRPSTGDSHKEQLNLGLDMPFVS